MGRKSIKENKSEFQIAREELKLSREAASELLETIPPEKLERIENGKLSSINPEDVLIIAERYNHPDLINYFCTKICPIGAEYVHEVRIKDLSQMILEMVASLNSMNKQKDRLIEIGADGVIDNEELDEFISIQNELEKISIMADALKLWSKKMIKDGKVNIDEYNRKNKL